MSHFGTRLSQFDTEYIQCIVRDMSDAAKEGTTDSKADAKAPDAAALAKELETVRAAMQVLLDKQTGYENADAKRKADADKAAADAKQAEKDAASKGGDLPKVLDLTRAELADAKKKADELAPAAARAAQLEALVKSDAEALEKKLTPEQIASCSHITDPVQRLPILRALAGMKPTVEGPKAPGASAPGASSLPVDLSKLSPHELGAKMQDPAIRAGVLAKYNGTKQRTF